MEKFQNTFKDINKLLETNIKLLEICKKWKKNNNLEKDIRWIGMS